MMALCERDGWDVHARLTVPAGWAMLATECSSFSPSSCNYKTTQPPPRPPRLPTTTCTSGASPTPQMTTCPPSARRPTRECHPRAAWVALCRVAQASIQGAMRARAVDLCQSSCVCVCVCVGVRAALSVCVCAVLRAAGRQSTTTCRTWTTAQPPSLTSATVSVHLSRVQALRTGECLRGAGVQCQSQLRASDARCAKYARSAALDAALAIEKELQLSTAHTSVSKSFVGRRGVCG